MEQYSAADRVPSDRFYASINLSPGQSVTKSYTWTAPLVAGTYTVEVGVFSTNWATNYFWASAAGTIHVGGTGPTSTPTATRTSTPSATPTTTPTPVATPGFTQSTTVSPTHIAPGGSTTIRTTLRVSSGTLSNGVVDIEVHDASNKKVNQTFFTGQSLATGQSHLYTYTWTAPSTPGTYSVQLGVFGPNWSPNYYWNSSIGTITVS